MNAEQKDQARDPDDTTSGVDGHPTDAPRVSTTGSMRTWLPVGATLLDRFELVELVGSGGMGTVYRAFDRERGAFVALKTLYTTDPTFLLRFKREFRALVHVTHPNLVTLHELFRDDAVWFFTMDLVDGVPFGIPSNRDDLRPPPSETTDELPSASASTTRSRRALVALPRVREALIGMVEGVSAIHATGRLHRDLKPSNVLITEDGRAVVLDFGLVSEPLDPVTESAPGSVAFGLRMGAVGTPAYVSPEQAMGLRAGPASDWFSVGVMLFEALTGDLPFDGPRATLVERLAKTPPPRPSRLVPEVPADLDALTVALLAVDPAERPDEPRIRAMLGMRERPLGVLAARAPVPRTAAVDAFVAAASAARDELVRGASGLVLRAASAEEGSAPVDEVLSALREDPRLRVMRARCHPRDRIPYRALDSLVDRIVRERTRDAFHGVFTEEQASSLVRAFPVLEGFHSLRGAGAEPKDLPPTERVRRVAEGLARLLSAFAHPEHVVLVVDDLERADRASTEVLAHLLALGPAAPLLVVASYDRASDVRACLEPFARVPAIVRDLAGGLARSSES